MRQSVYHYWVKVSEDLWTKAHSEKVRLPSQALKFMLLSHGDTSYYQGRTVQLKKRSLGAGVYEVWFENEKERS